MSAFAMIKIVEVTLLGISLPCDLARSLIPKLHLRMDKGKATLWIGRKMGLYGLVLGRYAPLLPLVFLTLPFAFAGLWIATYVGLTIYWGALLAINVIDWITSGPRKKRLRKLVAALARKLTWAPMPKPAIDLA